LRRRPRYHASTEGIRICPSVRMLTHLAKVYLSCSFIIMQSDAFAQKEASVAEDAENVLIKPVKEVEAGMGGNIKLEREFRTQIESQYEWHTHLFWDSRYVSEGRDNLSGKSLLSASTEFKVDGFSIVPWLADGVNTDYTEFDLNVIYASTLTKSFVLYTGYTYVHTRSSGDATNDNELSLDLTYSWLEDLAASTRIYYSFDANGSFMEAALNYNNKVNEKINYGVQASLGANEGYISDGHDGLNNIQLIANFSYYPGMRFELYSYAGYNQAINRDAKKYAGDELLDNFFWTGVGVIYLF
jgi:hypothetical protein